jgi:hypothetical protein
VSRDVIKYGLFDAAALLAATEWRETLAANLATAGALCRAYLSGVYAASSWLSGQLDGQNAWQPGCGRPMPGWKR